MKNKWGRDYGRPLRMWLALLLSILTVFLVPSPPSSAHGGVIIDTGFTDHVEWLVSVDPYPTLMGEAMITLLVYNIVDYAPVNDLTVEAYPMAPAEAQDCCAAGADPEPITLIIDPEIYPGDYSHLIPLDQPGEWSIRFSVTAPDERSAESFEVVVPLTIHASMGGSERIELGTALTPDIDATATAFAQNVRNARQVPSPLVAASSPLTVVNGASESGGAASGENSAVREAFAVESERGGNWLLWGGLGLIPILLIGWFTLRSSEESEDHLS